MRKIPPGRQSMTGGMPSRHRPGQVAYESLLERDFLKMLEASWEIEALRTQPFTLNLKVNGRNRVYTPDVEVEWRDDVVWPLGEKVAVFEVKPWVVLRKEFSDLAPKLREARRYLASDNKPFIVVTDRFIRGPLLKTALAIVDGLRSPKPSEKVESAAASVLAAYGGALSINDLKAALSDQFQWPKALELAIWHWLGTGFLLPNSAPPITDNTIVRMC